MIFSISTVPVDSLSICCFSDYNDTWHDGELYIYIYIYIYGVIELFPCYIISVMLLFVSVSLVLMSWPLHWRHNGRDSVSNHQPHDCLLNCLFRRRSKKASKLRVTGLYVWNSPGTGEFPAQMASNAENVSIWWSHHAKRGTRASAIMIFSVNFIVFFFTKSILNYTLDHLTDYMGN